MTFVQLLPITLPFTAAILVAVFFWRKTLTLQESLDNLVRFNGENVATLQAKVAEIPALIAETRAQAVAAYIAANPPPATGPVTIDGVTYDSLIAAIQAITSQSGLMLAQSSFAVSFANANQHDNPWYPDDPPAVDS